MRNIRGAVFAAVLAVLVLLAALALAEPVSFAGLTADSEDTVIDFGSIRVDDVEGLKAFLDRMPCLERVDMYASSLTEAQMSELFDSYPQIFFGWTLWVGDHKVRTDVSAFSTLHGQSPDPIHNEKNFAKLRFCKNLKALDIGHNWVEDLSFIKELPNLEVLIIAINPVGDISALAELHNLVYLEMFTCRVHDITPLLGLTNLRDLNIKNNPIDDLEPLKQMKSLQRLWLGMGMEISQEERASLAAALPDCEMDFDNNPTEGTWRKHPHYFALYDFFRTREYVPFDDL